MSGTKVKMEVDTGAEVSTMPITIYGQKLSHVPLCPSTVRLRQYDGSMLPTKGEIDVVIAGKFVIVDITNDQLPLLGKDWLLKLRLDRPKLLGYMAVHKVDVMELKSNFPDVFKKELGLLQGIEAVIDLKEGAKP